MVKIMQKDDKSDGVSHANNKTVIIHISIMY
jgi:hypothetical protein